MAHAHGARGVELCARAGVQSIEHASFIDAAGIAACLASGTVLVPTLLVFEPPSDGAAAASWLEARRRREACLRAAAAAGVKFALGSDFVGWPPGQTAREFALMQRLLGFAPLQAVACGTGWAAR